jgi:hypothetical protein
MMGISGIAQAIMSGVGDQNAPPQQQPQPGPMPVPQAAPDQQDQGQSPNPFDQFGQGATSALIEAIMRGNAHMQSEAQGKQALTQASEKIDSLKPVVVTSTHDPMSGRLISSTYKNVPPPDVTNPGPQVASIVSKPFNDVHDTLAQNKASQVMSSGVDAIAQAIMLSPKAGDEKFSQDFGSGYKASREMGASPMAAFVDGLRTEFGGIKAQGGTAGPYRPHDTGLSSMGSIQAQVDRKKALDEAAMVQGHLPTLQGAPAEERAQQSHSMAQEAEFERFSSPQNLINYPTAGDALRAAKNEFGDALTPERTADVVTSHTLAQKSMQSSRQSARYEAMRTRITPDAMGLSQDLPASVRSVFDPNNMPQSDDEWKTAMNMAQTAKRQWQNASAEKRQALALQGQEIELKRGQILVAQQGNAIAAAALRQSQGTGEAALAGLPEGVKGLVRGTSTGRIDSTELLSARNPNALNFASLVNRYDPSWSTAIAPAREALYKSMTSGKIADQRNAINTVIPHIDELNSAALALNNAPAQLWNRIANKGITAVGDPRVTRYMTAANAVSKELGRAYSGGGQTTDSDTDAWRASLNVVQSPAQARAAVETLVRLLGGKARALKDQVSVGQGPVDPLPFRILSPESRAVLTKNHIMPDQVEGDTAAAAPAAGNVITDPRVFDKLFPPGKGK